jgi:pSer/pThr/pTyr-binding forkhead associated (FHA) protein
MKDDLKRRPKVSLLFYSEEEGKRVMVDRWTIEEGKKYTIGRSKKKVDISIQDITISRIHSEFIFYDKDKIMIKDFNSSNGTFINKQRIEPNKENYFSLRDTLSIGDEKKQLIFSIQNDFEEESDIRNDFDNNIIEKKNKNEEINQNKINKEEKDYYENEKIKNNKYYKKEKSKSFSSHNDSSQIEKDKYYEDENKNYKYRKDKYENNRDYNLKDKYDDINYKNKRYRNRKESSSLSRSRSFSRKKQYNKRDVAYRKNKKMFSRKAQNSDSDSEKSSKKNKHKNILSYIIKQEEEIEKENDKKQIRLYNEYLKIKEEADAKLEMDNLPNLLPVLTAKSEDDDYDKEEYSEEKSEESEVKKDVIILPRHLRRKIRTGIISDFKIFNRRKNFIKKNGINRNFSSYRNKIRKKIRVH